jgi:hypothetical protein
VGREARLVSRLALDEAPDAVALAQPTAASRAAVAAFALKAERYWNPAAGAYAYLPGTNRRSVITYFDDNGWWARGW